MCGFSESQILNPATEKENARRLVACWNACGNIPTEWLESVSEEIAVRSFAETIKERDALKAENELNLAANRGLGRLVDELNAENERLRESIKSMLSVASNVSTFEMTERTAARFIAAIDTLDAAIKEKKWQ